MAETGPLIVTGASGHLGQLVIKELLDTHKVQPSKIIAVSRSVDKLADLKQKGVDVRAGDFNDANSLKRSTRRRSKRRLPLEHIVFTSVVSQPKNLKQLVPELLENEAALAKVPGITYSILGYNL